MMSTIELDEELENRFGEIKHRLSGQLGYEPSNEEVVGKLMAAYDSSTANPPAEVRRGQPPTVED